MKSNHTKSGQQDPTSYQHTGTENKGNTFIADRETQNQQNPAAQQSKFNTLASEEEETEQDNEEIYTDRPVKMSAGDPEGNALNIGDTDGDNEDGLEEGIEEEEEYDDDAASTEETEDDDEIEEEDDLAEDDELTEDKDGQEDRDKF
jgi:hypothetical protein